jgi:hypothetical protein
MVAALQDGARADLGIVGHHAMRADMGGGINSRRSGHDGSGMDARGEDGFGKKERQYPGESDAGVGNSNEGLDLGSEISRDDDRRGGAGFSALEIGFVLGEGKVSGSGPVSGSEAAEDDRAISHDFPLEVGGDFSGGKWHSSLAQEWPDDTRNSAFLNGNGVNIEASGFNSTPSLGIPPPPAAKSAQKFLNPNRHGLISIGNTRLCTRNRRGSSGAKLEPN